MVFVLKRDPDKTLINSYTVETLQEYWVDLASRQLWIRGIDANPSDFDLGEPGVEFMMASKTIMNLNLLKMDSDLKPVVAHLHTCGGNWTEGIALYDAIRFMPYEVYMVSYTHARSMSSIMLQAANIRILMPNSYFLFHEGSWAFEGTHKAAVSNMEWDLQCSKKMIEIYVDNSISSKKFKGKSRSYVEKYFQDIMDKKEDVFLTPKEAVEWNLADGIFDGWKGNIPQFRKR